MFRVLLLQLRRISKVHEPVVEFIHVCLSWHQESIYIYRNDHAMCFCIHIRLANLLDLRIRSCTSWSSNPDQGHLAEPQCQTHHTTCAEKSNVSIKKSSIAHYSLHDTQFTKIHGERLHCCYSGSLSLCVRGQHSKPHSKRSCGKRFGIPTTKIPLAVALSLFYQPQRFAYEALSFFITPHNRIQACRFITQRTNTAWACGFLTTPRESIPSSVNDYCRRVKWDSFLRQQHCFKPLPRVCIAQTRAKHGHRGIHYARNRQVCGFNLEIASDPFCKWNCRLFRVYSRWKCTMALHEIDI